MGVEVMWVRGSKWGLGEEGAAHDCFLPLTVISEERHVTEASA